LVGRRGRAGSRRRHSTAGEQIAGGVAVVVAAAGGEQIRRIALDRAAVVAAGEETGAGAAAAAGEAGERIHVGEPLPVGEAFAPDVGIGVHLAAVEALLDLGDGHRTDLLLIDHQVPDSVLAGGCAVACVVVARVVEDLGLLLERLTHRLLGSALSGDAAHDDDVAAFLAADLEYLAANFF